MPDDKQRLAEPGRRPSAGGKNGNLQRGRNHSGTAYGQGQQRDFYANQMTNMTPQQRAVWNRTHGFTKNSPPTGGHQGHQGQELGYAPHPPQDGQGQSELHHRQALGKRPYNSIGPDPNGWQEAIQPPHHEEALATYRAKRKEHEDHRKAMRKHWRANCCDMHNWFQLLYWIFVLPMLFLIIVFAVLMCIPWSLFASSRPHHETGEVRTREKVSYMDREDRDKQLATLFEWIGYGPEARPREEKHRSIGFWRFFNRRGYTLYELVRAAIHSFHRQSLQIIGILVAIAIIVMQVLMMVHDLSNSEVSIQSSSGF